MPLIFLQDPSGITRGGAREDAERELRKAVYRVGEKGPVERVVDWLIERVEDVFDRLVRLTPGGTPSLVLLVVAIVALVVAVRLGLGPAHLRDALTDRRRGARGTSAAEYRAEAELLAAQGRYKDAVRARFRAVIRELEERGVLDPRPGRTAGEIAREGSDAVPAVRDDLHACAATFDLVWYGRRETGEAEYAILRDADDRVRAARLATVSA